VRALERGLGELEVELAEALIAGYRGEPRADGREGIGPMRGVIGVGRWRVGEAELERRVEVLVQRAFVPAARVEVAGDLHVGAGRDEPFAAVGVSRGEGGAELLVEPIELGREGSERRTRLNRRKREG